MWHPRGLMALALMLAVGCEGAAFGGRADAGHDARVVEDASFHDDAAADASGPDNSVITATPAVDLYAFKSWGTASGISEISLLTGASNYQTFAVHDHGMFVPAHPHGALDMITGDFDTDHKIDLFIVGRDNTHSGVTEMHVMSGADNYATLLFAVATGFAYAGEGRNWQFRVGDYNRDSHPDLYGIVSMGTGSGKIEVHVVGGDSSLTTFIEHTATALAAVADEAHVPQFALADINNDGAADLYAVTTVDTPSGKTEVVVLDGANKFATELARDTTSLTAAPPNTSFLVADANGDGAPDLFEILRAGTGSGMTEITITSGADHFQTVLRRGPTALPPTVNGDGGWGFDMGHP